MFHIEKNLQKNEQYDKYYNSWLNVRSIARNLLDMRVKNEPSPSSNIF